jgi:predicted nucleotidyltransferase
MHGWKGERRIRYRVSGSRGASPGSFLLKSSCDMKVAYLSRRYKSAIMSCDGGKRLMKTLDEIRQILEAQEDYLAVEYGVRIVGVFGSYVRGEQRRDSDVDILIELERPPRISLIGLVELEYYLGDLLGMKVDVAIKRNLRKRIGERILSEVVPL